MNIFYVFSSRWVGDLCPVEYAETLDDLLLLLVSNGWQRIDEAWIAPKNSLNKQVPINNCEKGRVLQGVLEDGFVIPFDSSADSVLQARQLGRVVREYQDSSGLVATYSRELESLIRDLGHMENSEAGAREVLEIRRRAVEEAESVIIELEKRINAYRRKLQDVQNQHAAAVVAVEKAETDYQTARAQYQGKN